LLFFAVLFKIAHVYFSLQEHVIELWSETSDILHNALVHQYQAKVQLLQAGGKSAETELAAVRAKLLRFLETSRHYNPQVVIVQFPVDCKYFNTIAVHKYLATKSLENIMIVKIYVDFSKTCLRFHNNVQK
jgi:hypothetical protein